MGKKEKLLVTSNFSFSYNVFHSCISLVSQNAVLYGNGLRRVVVSGQWSLTAGGLLIQVVSNTSLTVFCHAHI